MPLTWVLPNGWTKLRSWLDITSRLRQEGWISHTFSLCSPWGCKVWSVKTEGQTKLLEPKNRKTSHSRRELKTKAGAASFCFVWSWSSTQFGARWKCFYFFFYPLRFPITSKVMGIRECSLSTVHPLLLQAV